VSGALTEESGGENLFGDMFAMMAERIGEHLCNKPCIRVMAKRIGRTIVTTEDLSHGPLFRI
jgi:hypothetical protein